MPAPRTFHFDRRLKALLESADGDDDALLTTDELVSWLGVSRVWAEIARTQNYGPPFIRLGKRYVRYRFGDVRLWLKSRSVASTAEYRDKFPGEPIPFERKTA